MERKYLELIKKLLEEFTHGTLSTNIKEYYHEDLDHHEYPNRLSKHLIERNLEEFRTATLKGKQVLQSEEFEIVNYFELGDTAIVEVVWTGILAVEVSKFNVGDEIKAYFAQFYEFKDGKIYTQRNYNCYDFKSKD